MIGEITSLKQLSQRDDVKSSGSHGIRVSFSHSMPHLIHFTRNLFILLNQSRNTREPINLLNAPYNNIANRKDLSAKAPGDD
jgi:hypothetical protein